MSTLIISPEEAQQSQTIREEADQIMEFGATNGIDIAVPALANYTDMDVTSREVALDMVESIGLATIRRMNSSVDNLPNTLVRRDHEGNFSANDLDIHDLKVHRITFSDNTSMITVPTGGGGGPTTATNVSVAAIPNLSATNVQTALAAHQTKLDSHTTDISGLNTSISTLSTTVSTLPASAVNIGSGVGLFKTKSGTNLQFKSIKAGTGVNITNDVNEITVSANNIVTLAPVGTMWNVTILPAGSWSL